MYTCFLFGHSDAPDSLRESLENMITYHVEKLFVSKFIVGHYGNFDRMAIAALRKAKRKYPQISCYLLIPYFFGAAEVPVPDGFENTYHPIELLNVPKPFAIPRANRLMVDNADTVICYVRFNGSNSGRLLRHARARVKKGLLNTVVNLADVLYVEEVKQGAGCLPPRAAGAKSLPLGGRWLAAGRDGGRERLPLSHLLVPRKCQLPLQGEPRRQLAAPT